ncbi:MAG: cytidine deaminase [Bacteroidetes bacterium]|nr:cytidine deaminase [Bacteroidota bacterium]
MEKKSIICSWTEYPDRGTIPARVRELLDAAAAACDNSYAPYSNFYVGAAARMEDGSIILGANMENASYPLCICAEKSCVSNSESYKKGLVMEIIAITAKGLDHPVSPCGSCRQILVEKEQRQGKKMEVYLFGETGLVWHFHSAEAFLPMPFDSSDLNT